MSDAKKKSLFRRGLEKKPILEEVKEVVLDEHQTNAVMSRNSNTLVVAGAGSGKTAVLTQRVRHLIIDEGVKPSNIIAITFTNMAAEEMKERLSNVDGIGDSFIGTIHSFANRVMKLSGEVYRIYDDAIENDLMGELINKYAKFLTRERFLKYKDLKEKESMGQVSDYEVKTFFEPSEQCEFHLFTRSKGEKVEGLDLYGIAFSDYPETIETLCAARKVITFDELLRKAERYFRSIDAQIEHVLVDEFQDVGMLEFQFIEALQADNYFFVGDDWQCQPRGTRVLMEDGTNKNIEDIVVGDRVVSYSVPDGYYYKLTKRGHGKEVIGVSEQMTDAIITIITETNKESSYTKNHRCLARIHYDGNEDKSVVYIMENAKGQFRVGSTKLFTGDGRNFGVRGRMNTEGGIRAWILDVFDTSREAWMCEQICSYKFGIPQMTWAVNNTDFTSEEIDSLYHHLDNIRFNVSECLKTYGRDISYPIFIKDENKHFSKIHVTEVHACNLIPRVMDVAVPVIGDDGRLHNSYENIKYKKVIEDSCVPVYGLKVAGTETYVADGILTHNSIYGFKGGNVNIFKKLVADGIFSVYYLNNNYRNGRQILDVAETVINQVTGKIDKAIVQMCDEEGEVTIDTKKNVDKYLRAMKDSKEYKSTFILTRSNKELYEVSDMMEDIELPYVTFKREGMSLADIREKMAMNKVKLLTVHVSKGLEADNVLMYGNFPIVCPKYRISEEERKVMYVGITRARKRLCILN